ncbi:MAG: hypothetical protein ACR2QG_06090 [Gammaproteobacteria bacterium]
MLGKLLDKVKTEKPEDKTYRLIYVEAINLRAISMQAIHEIQKPIVMLDSETVKDYSERGPLRRRRIAEAEDFEIRDGSHPVLGFHGGPDQMWFSDRYTKICEHCAKQGWLTLKT